MAFEKFDLVEITEDIEEDGLKRGMVGVIVSVYDDPHGYEMEFMDRDERIITWLKADCRQIRPLLICPATGLYYMGHLKPFMKLSGGIDLAIKEEFEFWAPDLPLINCIFGAIGAAFFKEAMALDVDTISRFLALVEEGMLSDDEEYGTAIATGLIEAIVNLSCLDNMAPWRYIEPFMGQESLEYAEGWRKHDFKALMSWLTKY